MTLWEEICRTALPFGLVICLAAPASAAPGSMGVRSFAPMTPHMVGRGTVRAGRFGENRRFGERSFRHGRRGGGGGGLVGGVIVPVVPYGDPGLAPDVGSAWDSRGPVQVVPAAAGAYNERWIDRDPYVQACAHPLIIELSSAPPAAHLPQVIYGSRPPVCGPRG